ncbi:hypothetical protein V8F33_008844 [Rhypophila sp. PSN 637]
MAMLDDIILTETTALIKDIGRKIDNGTPFGSFSTSLYDTAWLARFRTPNGDWLFPQCFQHLLQMQEPGGGWPVYGAEMDGLLSTMAALVALRDHQEDRLANEPGKEAISCPPSIGERIHQAEECLRQRLQSWDVASTVHVGFEMLVPALLRMLEKDSNTKQFEFPGRPALMSMNQRKLAKMRPEVVYGPKTTTLVHSLEALVGSIDFDRVSHHLNEHGSMMGSPAATAAYLMNSSQWSAAAETYLKSAVAHSSGLGSGGVPGAFPSALFEVSWITSTLLKSRPSAGILLDSPESTKIGAFLHSQFERHGGTVGFDSGLLADVDDTAKTIISLRLLGLPVSPKTMIGEFEGQRNFRTYQHEQNGSFSANCNVLDALFHCQDPQGYRDQVVKVSRSLCTDLLSGRFRDKWNLSDGYSFMLLSQAFVKLLKTWDRDHLGQLPVDLISEEIPIALLQTLLQTLHTQSANGFWTFGANNTASREITAYAVLTLKSLSSIPWHSHLWLQVEWHVNDHLWVAKVSYALPPVARAYIIAALGAESGPSYSWGDKVKETVRRNLASFFPRLPTFSQETTWALEGDVMLGHLYQSPLSRATPPERQGSGKVENKYLAYIPFTWIATNRRNNYPLPSSVLWDMMVTSVLIYKLDEFMETVCGNDEMDDQSRQRLRSTVQELCDFHVDHEEDRIGHHSDSSAEADLDCLKRYTSHILNNPAVLQSPSPIRKQLHSALAICLLAHIDSEEDNIQFSHQRKTQRDEMTCSNFTHPRDSTYYTWVQTTSANSTQTPSTFIFFTCLSAAAASVNTSTPRSGRRRALLRRSTPDLSLFRTRPTSGGQYTDLGSAARDKAEGNLNSVDFAEFHIPSRQPHDKIRSTSSTGKRKGEDYDGDGHPPNSSEADLLYLAEYERECMHLAMEKLHVEMCKDHHHRGTWKMSALRVFVDTVILYGEIYLARDISNRRRAA